MTTATANEISRVNTSASAIAKQEKPTWRADNDQKRNRETDAYSEKLTKKLTGGVN